MSFYPAKFRFMVALVSAMVMAPPVFAETMIQKIPTQYIAALGDKNAKSGSDAETWGLWPIDPGPRGVRLSGYESLKSNNGIAPAKWTFNASEWWLEEHGLIMEQPVFPITAGKYVVTGGREATAILTVEAKGSDGKQHWQLDNNATLYDVTHLGCRAARYSPESSNSCTPASANQGNFPVEPGAAMPSVGGCNKQDYQVLIVEGMVVEK